MRRKFGGVGEGDDECRGDVLEKLWLEDSRSCLRLCYRSSPPSGLLTLSRPGSYYEFAKELDAVVSKTTQ